MALTEKEEKIVNYMADRVATSVEKLDTAAKEMVKFNTGIITVLTALATYFNAELRYLIIPVISIFIGIAAFILTTQPTKIEYTVGEVESSLSAYNLMVKRKSRFIKAGYLFTYVGIAMFIIVILK
jgi:sorbitol-specific phosphotransferase system component IIC